MSHPMSDIPDGATPAERLDAVFYEAFETNDPAMHDWVRIRIELKSIDSLKSENQRLREALRGYVDMDDCFCVDGAPDQPPSKKRCLYCTAKEALGGGK